MEEFDYYIFIDYSDNLIGYIIIEKEKIKELLPKISKLHHYRKIKHRKQYIAAIKKRLMKNSIKSLLLKYKIGKLKENIIIFAEILEFVKKYNNCGIFISIDNNQYKLFIKLFKIIPHQRNTFIVKESNLRKGSVEYNLSLIIDTLLNIVRTKN
ncbi:hypothetical protein HYX16_03185 [Candidatus Woesearchaeota archaeon]|nr:hypothetical protein [Candidatus Woesearchaeota archaeon]